MESARKAPIEEKLNAFGDIVENIMNIVLKIPDLVDQTLAGLNQKISGFERRLNQMSADINAIKAGGGGGGGAKAAAGGAPGGAPGGPPGGPPPPPGGPPGGPPPPPGGPGGPGGPGQSRPSSPATLRGAIMSELKSLFKKRKQTG